MKTFTLIVLNDEESYTSADGCTIVTITKEGMDLLDDGEKIYHLPEEHIISELFLTDFRKRT